MNDSDVLTAEHYMMIEPKIRLTTRGVRWMYGLTVFLLLVGFGTYVSSRLKATYRLADSQGKHVEAFRAYSEATDARLESLAARVNEIERTMPWLAADIKTQAPASAPTPAVVQSWQVNRDIELRRRINSLEQARLEQQMREAELRRKIQDLEQALKERR